MNLFDQYGIHEVANVTIESIHKKKDGSGDIYYVPALYLDTLKVSTVEKSAENTWAQGGIGNSRLISWDYGKTINLSLEDALVTPANLGLCWGGILSADWKNANVEIETGLRSLECANERISRTEKAFYPRNDTVNATISHLLPRDGKEDIFYDQSGDPVFLQRSSILDGVNIKGFGYVNSKPYKWFLEIETAVKSVAVVPDRFFSIYGKSYPIKRRQTVAINQPSESFKYEIIYLRGYDKYDDESPKARIIYHKQMEMGEETKACSTSDTEALTYLNDAENYPYLKLRVCWDGSVRAYLGSKEVNWDLTRQIEDSHATPDINWVEIPQINTDQFRNIDLWVRFDSINALSYYLITKYENNIFDISPKIIKEGLEKRPPYSYMTAEYSSAPQMCSVSFKLKAGTVVGIEPNQDTTSMTDKERVESIVPVTLTEDTDFSVAYCIKEDDYQLLSIIDNANGALRVLKMAQNTGNYNDWPRGQYEQRLAFFDFSTVIPSDFDDSTTISYVGMTTTSPTRVYEEDGETLAPSNFAGKDYWLKDPSWTTDTECTPCCKKDNLSRSIWAYVNPKTMTPYDDDYWFHQGEPYIKKSLTLSTSQNPVDAKKIYVQQGVFPGMYKITLETLIRERETGDDERVQIVLPLCKIMSNQSLTLQADGDPTTFSMEVEVATPPNGVPMEITFFNVEKETTTNCRGNKIEKDGSTRIAAK